MKINNKIINLEIEPWKKDILRSNFQRRNKLELIAWSREILVTMRAMNLWIKLSQRIEQLKLKWMNKMILSSIHRFSIRLSFKIKFWVRQSELMLLLSQLTEVNRSQILVVVVVNRGSLRQSNAIGILFTQRSDQFQLQ